jgi:monovalent cation:H+ antiporter, CPA1 family
VVVFLFLPVLIFAAALGIDLRAFMRNLGAILALAVLAFLVSAVLVGITLHWALGVALAAAFLFGALISATDPVAVVAVFREVGVPRRLLTLVEGESLLNDGVAIVLFAILVEAAMGGSVSITAGIIDFVAVFGGGALIGIVLGLVAALGLPWLGRLPAAALSLAVAYGSFVLSALPRLGGGAGDVGADVGGAGLRRQRAVVSAHRLGHRPGSAARPPRPDRARRGRRARRPGTGGRAAGLAARAARPHSHGWAGATRPC